ncbi:MAG: agmatine deiminase family protein [Bacteroidia bacterium]|nr:agmatine deiminase family protein [Bacteroidia bacterium]
MSVQDTLRRLLCWLAVGIRLLAGQSDPRLLNDREMAQAPDFLAPAEYRLPAEWEETEYLLLAWVQYTPVLREIVRYAQEECTVVVLCTDSAAVRQYLAEGQVPADRVRLLPVPVNSVWIRDYGPATVFRQPEGTRYLMDWVYNRPRPLDDAAPAWIAAGLQIPLLDATRPPDDLVLIGGNLLSDGIGTAFSSNLTLSENGAGSAFTPQPKTEAQIDRLLARHLGIRRYIRLPELPFDGIHHLDMHFRLLDEETLLVGEYPPGVADGPQIEANLQQLLSQHGSPFGTPYRVVRIPMPPDHGAYPDTWWADYRTYTNAVLINRTLLMPLYEPKYDSAALAVWRRQLPGYRIIGIDCNQIIEAGGALRCITLTIPIEDPLQIVHQPLRQADGGQAAAWIRHRSGIRQAWLHAAWQPEGPFTAIPMQPSGTQPQQWTAPLPQPPPEAHTLYYYLEAESYSGRRTARPLPGAAGPWRVPIGHPGISR